MSDLARNAFAVTPSDATPVKFDALHVGVGGTVTIKDLDGTSVQFTAPAGGYILAKGTYVMATGTAATAIVGLTL